nr:hypothetical protein [Tanacetum cinerariifolium]
MGDEHFSTISETKSDEVIKSSIEDLVLIPSEYEVTSDNEKLNAEIADTILESLSPSSIRIEDSDSQMKEIHLILDTDDLMPPEPDDDVWKGYSSLGCSISPFLSSLTKFKNEGSSQAQDSVNKNNASWEATHAYP